MECLGALNRRADWPAGRCLPFTRLERRKSLTIILGSVAASHTSRGISQIQSRARSAPCDRDDVVRSLRSGAHPGPVDEDDAKRQQLQPVGGAGEVRRVRECLLRNHEWGGCPPAKGLPFGTRARRFSVPLRAPPRTMVSWSDPGHRRRHEPPDRTPSLALAKGRRSEPPGSRATPPSRTPAVCT